MEDRRCEGKEWTRQRRGGTCSAQCGGHLTPLHEREGAQPTFELSLVDLLIKECSNISERREVPRNVGRVAVGIGIQLPAMKHSKQICDKRTGVPNGSPIVLFEPTPRTVPAHKYERLAEPRGGEAPGQAILHRILLSGLEPAWAQGGNGPVEPAEAQRGFGCAERLENFSGAQRVVGISAET